MSGWTKVGHLWWYHSGRICMVLPRYTPWRHTLPLHTAAHSVASAKNNTGRSPALLGENVRDFHAIVLLQMKQDRIIWERAEATAMHIYAHMHNAPAPWPWDNSNQHQPEVRNGHRSVNIWQWVEKTCMAMLDLYWLKNTINLTPKHVLVYWREIAIHYICHGAVVSYEAKV